MTVALVLFISKKCVSIHFIIKFLADACEDIFLKNFATPHLLKALLLIKTIYMQSLDCSCFCHDTIKILGIFFFLMGKMYFPFVLGITLPRISSGKNHTEFAVVALE